MQDRQISTCKIGGVKRDKQNVKKQVTNLAEDDKNINSEMGEKEIQ